MSFNVAVIGGGAAGFFGAINIVENNPNAVITIFEKSNQILAKVRVSGGGRCNVTHNCFENYQLIKNYPRGEKKLGKIFNQFSVTNTIEWFKKRGVTLKTEADNRMFPVTDNSQTIVNCFLDEALKHQITIKTQSAVTEIIKQKNQWLLTINNEKHLFDKVLITSGGHPKIDNYQFISSLSLKINKPIPSLFTFNIPNSPLKGLEGIAQPVSIKTSVSKYTTNGPLLITHWGLSAPAVLRLSAWLAKDLFQHNYDFKVKINWLIEKPLEDIKTEIQNFATHNKAKNILSNPVFDISKRLWERFCVISEIQESKKYADLSKKELNKLSELLYGMELEVKGKTTFKEEFVTCGGVDLEEIDMETMQCKKHENLYFAGEVIDIDAITGGFNFQAAWSTAFVAAKNMAITNL
jgi:predicted Rossmann fold flavoprotein